MPILFILISLCVGFAFGYLIRLTLPFIATQQQARRHNLSLQDRLIRFSSGIALLVFGIYFQSFVLLIFAGFSFFEALAQWCVLYAFMGKNNCPL